MTTGSIVGFALTVVALLTFMGVSWWQLVRIRRTARDELSVGSADAEPAEPGDGT